MKEEKEITNTGEYKKMKYEFLLRINDQIICQRFFDIFNFNPDCIYSCEFKKKFDQIIDMIKEDLTSKTRVYMYHVCPSFADKRKLDEFQKAGFYKSELWSEIDDEFIPGAKKLEETLLVFEFKVMGRTVMTAGWSANEYPKFIRSSINICNHQFIQATPTSRIDFKKVDDNTLKYEHLLKKRIHMGREDLVPKIIKIFRDVCSMENEYYTLIYHPNNWKK
jgi:hypothetical protein